MEKRLPAGEFYGRTVGRRDLAGVTLTESVLPGGLDLAKHSHANAYFCAVLRGTFTETYGRKSRDCGPPLLKFHPPDEVHAERFHRAGARLLRIEIRPDWLDHLRRHTTVLDGPAAFEDGELTRLTTRLHSELRSTDRVSNLAIEGLALEIVVEATRRSLGAARPGRLPWLTHVREILDAQFADPPALADIAALVDVHPVYLSSAFRKRFGYSVGEYIRRRRIDYARRAISDSDAPLADIALAAGFSDQSHLSRVFKLYVGIPPADYRKLARPR